MFNVLFDTYIEELEIKCDPESIERVIRTSRRNI